MRGTNESIHIRLLSNELTWYDQPWSQRCLSCWPLAPHTHIQRDLWVPPGLPEQHYREKMQFMSRGTICQSEMLDGTFWRVTELEWMEDRGTQRQSQHRCCQLLEFPSHWPVPGHADQLPWWPCKISWKRSTGIYVSQTVPETHLVTSACNKNSGGDSHLCFMNHNDSTTLLHISDK